MGSSCLRLRVRMPMLMPGLCASSCSILRNVRGLLNIPGTVGVFSTACMATSPPGPLNASTGVYFTKPGLAGEGGLNSLPAVIDALDHFGTGTKVNLQETMLESHRTQVSLLHHAVEQGHISLAKGIDGLHRVADKKQASTVTMLPAFNQSLDQVRIAAAEVS